MHCLITRCATLQSLPSYSHDQTAVRSVEAAEGRVHGSEETPRETLRCATGQCEYYEISMALAHKLKTQIGQSNVRECLHREALTQANSMIEVNRRLRSSHAQP